MRATHGGLREGLSQIPSHQHLAACQKTFQPTSPGPASHSPGRPGSGTAQPGGPLPACWSQSGSTLLAWSRGRVAEPGHRWLPHWLFGRSCPRTGQRQKQENSEQVRAWWGGGGGPAQGVPVGTGCSFTTTALRTCPGPCQDLLQPAQDTQPQA